MASHHQLVFELADSTEDTYQVIRPCCGDKLGNVKVEDKPRKRRRFFWWFRGGERPGKLKNLESLEQKPEWSSPTKRDWYKPIQMLTYPQVKLSASRSSLSQHLLRPCRDV